LNIALGNGLWAALFVGLMVYLLKDTAKREAKYEEIEKSNRETLGKFADRLRVVNEIKTNTETLTKKVGKLEKTLSKKENNNDEAA
jgi:hypothetical protein